MTDTKQTHKRSRSDAALEVQRAKAHDAKALTGHVQKAVQRRPGQPTKFSPELWDEILEHIATYGDLIEICDRPDMPAVSTVYRWYRTDEELKSQIRTAWENASFLGHSVNQNILRGGKLSTGDFKRDEALVQNNRWHMGKTNRRDFGDKVQLDHVQHLPVVLDWDTMEGPGGDGV